MKWLALIAIGLVSLSGGYWGVNLFYKPTQINESRNESEEGKPVLENPDQFTGEFRANDVTSLAQYSYQSADPLDQATSLLKINARLALASESQLIDFLELRTFYLLKAFYKYGLNSPRLPQKNGCNL